MIITDNKLSTPANIQTTIIREKLEKLGFSRKEADVYLALLELGTAIVSDVAKKSQVNRSTAYILLDLLVQRGFVSISEKNKVKLFSITPPENLIQYISPQDLKNFGLIPELIGRLPVVTHLDPLDRNTLKRILLEPKNALSKQYVKLFEMDGIKLVFDEDVYEFIVNKAMEYKLGARGLRSICEEIMLDAMFDAPSEAETGTIHVNLQYAEEKFNVASSKKLKLAS